jgi:hypothetical protein
MTDLTAEDKALLSQLIRDKFDSFKGNDEDLITLADHLGLSELVAEMENDLKVRA